MLQRNNIQYLFQEIRNIFQYCLFVSYIVIIEAKSNPKLSHMMISISVPKNPHCAGARTVPALYGCGPHSNRGFHGH